MDMVRPGIRAVRHVARWLSGLGLRPVMTLKTTVSTIKTYEPGTDISYGRTVHHPTGSPAWACCPYGYADGFFRCLSNRCAVHDGGRCGAPAWDGSAWICA